MPVPNKTASEMPTSFSPGEVPDMPNVVPSLLQVDGFQEQNRRWQEWWDLVKERLFKTEQDTGISLRRGEILIEEEAIARETADGWLEGKYTLTVQAGDVVTGMEITSASGPNQGTVSQVSFRADKFQIYSGTTNKVMFVSDAIQDKVRIAGVLTVDGGSTALYIKTTAGAGAYNSAGTPWYVDANGRMSLGDRLVFDGTNLAISGAIIATSGSIGGWDINPTTIFKNNATLDSAGQLILGTASDVIYISAIDATYRLWVGSILAGSAAFSVTKTGIMSATGGTFSGNAYIGMTQETGFGLGTSSQINGPLELFSFGGGSFSSGNIFARLVGGSQAVKSQALAGSNFGMNGRVWDGATYQDFGRFSITTLQNATVNQSSIFSLYTKSTGNANQYLQFNDSGRLSMSNTGSVPSLFSGRINIDNAGTTSADGIYFGTDVNLYRSAANVLNTDDSFTVGGVVICAGITALGGLTATGIASFGSTVSSSGQFQGPNGSTGAPSFSFSSDTDTGWRWNSSGDMRAVTNNNDRLVVRDAAIVCLVPLKLDNNRTAGAPVAGGTVTMQDAAGTTVQVLVV